MGADLVRQHLIDPESCLRCDSCRLACANQAIAMIRGTLVIDHARCDGAGACFAPCETGAIHSWRLVPRADVYATEEQAAWERLPDQEDLGLVDSVNDSPQVAAPHRAPASAATPQINACPVHAPASARVVMNLRLTPENASSDIHHIVLDIGGTGMRVLEGQSVGVLPPGLEADGKPHAMRLYSVASARQGEAGIAGHVAFTVKRVTEDEDGNPHQGVCSNHLCDLAPGDTVRLVGPFGNSFLMPDDPAARLLMICTGTGIAPMRGMIERRRQMGTCEASALLLVYGGRTHADLPYVTELQAMAGTLIDLDLGLSRLPGQPRTYVQDRLRLRAADVAAVLSDANGYVYLCGLLGMEDGVMAAFEDICGMAGLSWPAIEADMKATGRLHIETY